MVVNGIRRCYDQMVTINCLRRNGAGKEDNHWRNERLSAKVHLERCLYLCKAESSGTGFG